MAREITEHDLRTDSDAIIRALEAGDSFIVTLHGVPVGQLRPLAPKRRFVDAATLVAAFANTPPTDAQRFRDDVDALIDQDITPRG